MAPSLRSRKLTCFYCGRRSPIQQDSSIREWKCGNCEAVNYLDENGEITDPPAAVVDKTSTAIQYAQVLPQDGSPSSSNPDNALFCADCLKNQHLVRSSLAQYVPEEEDTLAVDREYLKFKDSLEKRYPQVCEDCFEGVVKRLKQSSYTAKTDHLRRLLDKTRKDGTYGRTRRTWLDTFQFLGQLLWTLSIYGQLAWDVVGVSGYAIQYLLDLWVSDMPCLGPLASSESGSSNTLLVSQVCWMRNTLDSYEISLPSSTGYGKFPDVAYWSLVLGLISIWWNPKFKEVYRGYHRHIKGFYDWYTYQGLLLLVRVLFYMIMSLELFTHIDASPTLGAHLFMLLFTAWVVIKAQKSIKVDFGPLFAPTSPDRLREYVRPKDKSKYSGHDMSQALTSILDEPSTRLFASVPTNRVDPFYEDNLLGMSYRHRSSSPYEPQRRQISYGALSRTRSPPLDPRDIIGIPRTVPSLSDMTVEESEHYLSTGKVPARMQGEIIGNNTNEIMEWNPQASQHRAFQPARAPRQSQLFSQAPVEPDPSPFWYKGLPSAPISQAHRIRNPPNAPRLQPPSQEARENFFNRLTGQQLLSEPPDMMLQAIEDDETPHPSRRHEIEFTQQTFFPPTAAAGDAVAGLSAMFEQAFTLKVDEIEGQARARGPPKSAWERKQNHFYTALVLLLTRLGWNYSFAHPELRTMNIPICIMAICGAVGLRSIATCVLNPGSTKNQSFFSTGGAVVAAVQTAAAGYAITEIAAGRGDCVTCQSQGLILISIMFLQEVCLAASS